MLSKEDFAVIKALNRRGVYQKDIAEQLDVHPKTVSRALKRGEAPVRQRKRRPQKLDAYKAKVDQLLADGVWNAVVILREIQAAGYTGGYTMLRAYIAPKRALRAGRQTVRFETKPGQQLQSDWGEITTVMAGQESKVSFIVNELGYSRRFHLWCTDSQDAEHCNGPKKLDSFQPSISEGMSDSCCGCCCCCFQLDSNSACCSCPCDSCNTRNLYLASLGI